MVLWDPIRATAVGFGPCAAAAVGRVRRLDRSVSARLDAVRRSLVFRPQLFEIVVATAQAVATLYGLLGKVRDSGLPFIAVIQLDPQQANVFNVNADTDHNRCGHGSAST